MRRCCCISQFSLPPDQTSANTYTHVVKRRRLNNKQKGLLFSFQEQLPPCHGYRGVGPAPLARRVSADGRPSQITGDTLKDLDDPRVIGL